jgi:hypothetical protein
VTSVAQGNTQLSSELDTATKISATLYLQLGFIEAQVNTNPQRFIVQVSSEAADNDNWRNLAVYTIDFTGTPEREAITSQSTNTVTVASTTGVNTPGQVVYIQDAGAIGNSEWHHVESATGTVVTLYDAVTSAFDASDFINTAWEKTVQFDLSSVDRMRVVFENEGTTAADVHVKIDASTADSIA